MVPRPRARRDGLLVQELPEEKETLVYDRERHRAHCLGPSVSWIWLHCDGTRTVAEIAALLGRERGAPVGQDIVWLALRRLSRARLLEDSVAGDPGGSIRSRRELLRTAAVLGGLSVLSVTAPTAAQAATCVAEATCEGALDKLGCTGQACCDAPLGRICCGKGCKKFCCCQVPSKC